MGEDLFTTPGLQYFFHGLVPIETRHAESLLKHYVSLDDDDISIAVKMWMEHRDPVLSRLAGNLVNRRLFRIEIQNEPFANERIQSLRFKTAKLYRISDDQSMYFIGSGVLSNHAYNSADTGENILVMQKGQPVDLTLASDLENLFGMSKVVEKYFLCYPKELRM
jgi:hypothetical protein